jgi:hypothetical protein
MLITITDAEHKKRMGRAGKLDLNIDKVRLAGGEKALLRAVKDAKGGGHTGAMVGAMVATSLVVWPATFFYSCTVRMSRFRKEQTSALLFRAM